ncbi:unnamed protein product [Symbiodinium pilosum]|uniref:Uncharacterized protein n=1 Tax=Symbiodinium pilosum TaxID=2952 RepID=A0A812IZI9_SYMPI|nr:unnamed protein product [Symbiodinium pilosum]
MVTAKSKRKDLEVPDFVRDEWANGNRSAMAKILQDVNWNKEKFVAQVEVTIKSKHLVKLVVEEGWYSREEMITDLKWSETLALPYVRWLVPVNKRMYVEAMNT